MKYPHIACNLTIESMHVELNKLSNSVKQANNGFVSLKIKVINE